ncbi:hypothetical protein VT99_10444 [Candidatus Electrothrix marina]|uniref:Uncharacterized protein n=1 Tax=Candidatus Electrothrix marina TaxID=1859130 RepID=A0A3S3QJA1_9BACT|nr:hypothetical protein VT99_10444 [Candidatus Electrothrix marina]
MRAKKMILETDRHGRLLYQPDLPAGIRIEAIFLIPEKKEKTGKRRKPSPRIYGKGKILGDIMTCSWHFNSGETDSDY